MLSRRAFIGTGAALALAPQASHAAELPQGVVRFVVPFPPGGPADILGRILTPRLSTQLGRTVVIENRAGAGGMVGIEAVGAARPDGLTMGIATMGSLAMAPLLVPSGRFVPLRDVGFVSRVGLVPDVLVVNSRLPVRTLQEFLAYARQEPGRVTAASSGNGGIAHLAIEMLRLITGVQLTHVPYRGVAPAMNDLLAGQVDCMIADVTAFMGFLDDGKLRAITIAAPERSPLLPNVPTTAESGLPEFLVANWYGLVTARGMPEPVLGLLNAAAVAVLSDPEVVKALGDLGLVAGGTTSAQFRDFVEAETIRWTDVVRRTGAKLD